MILLRKILFFLLFSLFPAHVNGQSCTEMESAITYIENVLTTDMFFIAAFPKEDIEEPLIWYMQEKLLLDNKEDTECKISTCEATIKSVDCPSQKTTRNQAHYLLFASDIYDDQLLIKLLHNRDPRLNVPGGLTEYETWSRRNGGMVYLFHFDYSGCIELVLKEFEFKD